MEKAVQGWGILVLSVGFIAVALQGVVKGWLPNGPNGFKTGKGVSREEQPVGFWFFFLLYCAAGGYGVLHSLRVLLGSAQ